MVIINFIFPSHENLPEVRSYISYFEAAGIKCYSNLDLIEMDSIAERYYEWHIMGTHFLGRKRFVAEVNAKDKILIHEYASLSTGGTVVKRKIKDIIKKYFNQHADYYLYLNEYVKQQMHLKGRKHELRDMGVPDAFVKSTNDIQSEDFLYDLAYVGSMAKERKLEVFLDSKFAKGKKIILIGKPEQYLVNRYGKNKNIFFAGKVAQYELPGLISKAKACLNYIPDESPYNIQTSTKLLEYLTQRKKIISNKYKWVMNFIESNRLEYYNINSEYICISAKNKVTLPTWSGIIGGLEITKKILENENI